MVLFIEIVAYRERPRPSVFSDRAIIGDERRRQMSGSLGVLGRLTSGDGLRRFFKPFVDFLNATLNVGLALTSEIFKTNPDLVF